MPSTSGPRVAGGATARLSGRKAAHGEGQGKLLQLFAVPRAGRLMRFTWHAFWQIPAFLLAGGVRG
eukprot:11352357-Alexandrium_andersonii.AAC.1